MIYINIRESGTVETVDGFETMKEARAMLREYKIASNYYNAAYISCRCAKAWRVAL